MKKNHLFKMAILSTFFVSFLIIAGCSGGGGGGGGVFSVAAVRQNHPP